MIKVSSGVVAFHFYGAAELEIVLRRKDEETGALFSLYALFSRAQNVREFFCLFFFSLPALDVPVGKQELELKITNSKAFCPSEAVFAVLDLFRRV